GSGSMLLAAGISLTGRLPDNLTSAYRRNPMRTKLTLAFVERAAADPGADRSFFWDDRLPGFGLMVTEKGHRSYVVQYRKGPASKRMTINGVLSLAEARKEARKLLGHVARGGHPLKERREELAAQQDTLRSVVEEFLQREGKNIRSANRWRADFERLIF